MSTGGRGGGRARGRVRQPVPRAARESCRGSLRGRWRTVGENSMEASSDDARDAPRSPLRMLVLPEPQYGPPGSRQAGVRVAVPPHVPEDLLLPLRGVRPRPRRVDRARVPEAAIDEHDDLRADECEVGPPSGGRQRPVDAVAQAEAVDGGSQGELARRVATRGGDHPASNARRGRCRPASVRVLHPRRRKSRALRRS